ncbi:MAG: hypothetical protein ACR2RF_20680 [Geminicoccaceae bacterium]
MLSIIVGTYIEGLEQTHERASVKLHLAALRRLLDWLVAGGMLPINPTTSVKGPALQIRRGKTNVLTAAEVRTLLDSSSLTRTEARSGSTSPDVAGLRDRALIALMTFTFARIGAALRSRSRTSSAGTTSSGFACWRRAARCMTCPATTRWISI